MKNGLSDEEPAGEWILLVQSVLDGTADEAARARLRDGLAHDAALRRVYAEQVVLHSMLALGPTERADVRRAAVALCARPHRFFPRLPRLGLAVAAALLICFLVAAATYVALEAPHDVAASSVGNRGSATGASSSVTNMALLISSSSVVMSGSAVGGLAAAEDTPAAVWTYYPAGTEVQAFNTATSFTFNCVSDGHWFLRMKGSATEGLKFGYGAGGTLCVWEDGTTGGVLDFPTNAVQSGTGKSVPITGFTWGCANGTTNLVEISVPETLDLAVGNLFGSCTHLERAVFMGERRSLPGGLFSECHELKEVIGLHSLTSVPDSCFNNCSLTGDVLNVISPDVTSLGKNAFGCGNQIKSIATNLLSGHIEFTSLTNASDYMLACRGVTNLAFLAKDFNGFGTCPLLGMTALGTLTIGATGTTWSVSSQGLGAGPTNYVFYGPAPAYSNLLYLISNTPGTIHKCVFHVSKKQAGWLGLAVPLNEAETLAHPAGCFGVMTNATGVRAVWLVHEASPYDGAGGFVIRICENGVRARERFVRGTWRD